MMKHSGWILLHFKIQQLKCCNSIGEGKQGCDWVCVVESKHVSI